ncbi:MAG: hypothetical protein LBK67_07220 [Coriobacteriales bacterium]|jgi:hypothetical protein|nr:hypothetical protein [Coriobacteriales bacterium]
MSAARYAFDACALIAFSVSLAIKLNALLVTSDHHEFDVIEATGCASFAWIR